AVGEIAEDLGAAAFEGNVDEIEARALGEDFSIDLLVAADAGAAVADLTRDAPSHRQETRRMSPGENSSWWREKRPGRRPMGRRSARRARNRSSFSSRAGPGGAHWWRCCRS